MDGSKEINKIREALTSAGKRIIDAGKKIKENKTRSAGDDLMWAGNEIIVSAVHINNLEKLQMELLAMEQQIISKSPRRRPSQLTKKRTLKRTNKNKK
jgi:hypothetical protein